MAPPPPPPQPLQEEMESPITETTSSAILLRSLEEIERRHNAEASLRSMQQDIECAQQLFQELSQQLLVEDLQKQLVKAELTIEEIYAVQQQREQRQKDMADALVKELWQLSKQHGQLKSVEEQYKELMEQHDEVVAKLLQAEMELEEANQRIKRVQESSTANENLVKATETAVDMEEQEQQVEDESDLLLQEDESEPSTLADEETLQSSPPLMPVLDHSDQPEETTDAEKEFEVPEQSPIVAEEPIESQAPTVSIIPEDSQTNQDDEESNQPRLEQLDNKILMVVFAYLDALDILNMAQVNVSMYSRIDVMFGMNDDNDSTTIASDDQTWTNKPSNDSKAETPVTPASVPATLQPTGTIVQLPPPEAPAPPLPTTTNSTEASAAVAATPPRSNYKAPQLSVVTTPTTAATASTTSSLASTAASLQAAGSFEGPRNLFASLLQPRKSPTSASTFSQLSNTSNNNNAATTSSSVSNKSTSIMNAALANSMGSKLSDAELNAIIAMTKRLKEKEALANKLTTEKTEILAKLEASEAVKQFLISKCRELEESLQVTQDGNAKVALQIASDQEVISFLDGRVQELEANIAKIQEQVQTSQATLQRTQEQATQKSTIMGDMLQYEREKRTEQEREWKATKKLLIKEVKSCRAQVAALQAERDGYREQNEQLKQVVLSGASAGVFPPSPLHSLKKNYA
jgi:chromosome segregation ATPase